MIPHPTAEQCTKGEKVYESEHSVGYALWYPRMGGHSGMAVAVFDKVWREYLGGCVNVYVWHDGEFPFDNGQPPVELHHCDPQQFIEFGKKLKRINDRNKVVA